MPPWLDSGRLRSAALDLRGARALHRGATRPLVMKLLVVCSRLADGPMWLSLMVLLPLLDAKEGPRGAWLVLALGSTNLLIYWVLKKTTRRRRPFEQCVDIRACARVPDPFSFPSGHTLHAFAFAMLLTGLYPWLALPLWIFALMVAASRVVLGLHYPSDVLAGALIGCTTAALAVAAL